MTRIIIFAGMILFLFNCTPAPRYHYRDEPEKPASKQKGKVPTQRKTNSKKLTNDPILSMNMGDSAILTSSYYATKFHGRRTSNGEIFNMYGYSAAHKSIPFGTVLKVTYLKTGKSVMVKVNDRGPVIKGRDLDLSYMAAKKIGLLNDGVGRVKIRVVKWGEE